MSALIKKIRHALGHERRKLKSCIVAIRELNAATKVEGGAIANTLLLAHALEKGMGIQNVKEGYGIEKAEALCRFLTELKSTGQEYTYAFQEGLGVLWAYIQYQESNGIDVDSIRSFANELGQSSIVNTGYKVIAHDELMRGSGCNFEELVNSKHSIRKMTDDVISEEEIKTAIRLAGRAPSACNRQPAKVYYSLDRDKNKMLSQIVSGNKGFSEDIPYYCVVTSDRALFGGGAMFQWFVNGGIFVGYFALALHSLGLGSCIFQWPQFNEHEKELRSLIHADECEAII